MVTKQTTLIVHDTHKRFCLIYQPAFILSYPQERAFSALTWGGPLSRTDSCLTGSSAALKWRGRVVCKQTVVQLLLRRGMYINTPPRSESEPHCSLPIPTHLNTKDAFSFQLKFSAFIPSISTGVKNCEIVGGLINVLMFSVTPTRPSQNAVVHLQLHVVTHPFVFIGGQTMYNPPGWCQATAQLGWLKIWFT